MTVLRAASALLALLLGALLAAAGAAAAAPAVTGAAAPAVTGAAAPAVTGAAAPATAYLRLAHLSPDTPTVDVHVAALADPALSFVVPGVGYGAVSPYRPLPAGAYVVSMRPAGAPADAPAVVSATVDARAGAARTVAGTGMAADLGLTVLDDRLAAPAPGTASVRVVNGAASAPSVDVGPRGGPTWLTGVRFATGTAYRDVPLGTWQLQVGVPGRASVALPCQLDANSVYTVLLVDRGGALAAEVLRDSTGAAVVPVGGVEAGTGPAPGPPAALVGAGALAAAGAVLLLARPVAARLRARAAHRP